MNILKKINLDVARLIASFMIVAIHIYPLAVFNENLDYTFTRILFRIAVPLFLMITGYYVMPKAIKDINALKKYTYKILKLYVISILIYLPINIYNNYFSNFNIITIIRDLFINGTFYHLWYFPALILGIWITYIIIKKINSNKAFLLFLLLYIIGLFGDNYYGLIINIKVLKKVYDIIFLVSDYTRNGLFFTPIFIYLGYKFYNEENNLDLKKNMFYIIAFILMMLGEGLLLHYFKIPRHSSMYIFLIPLVILIFNLLIFNTTSSNKKMRNMATWIYILHPLFIVIVRLISKILGVNILIQNNFIQYLIVLVFTITFINIYEKNKGSNKE